MLDVLISYTKIQFNVGMLRVRKSASAAPTLFLIQKCNGKAAAYSELIMTVWAKSSSGYRIEIDTCDWMLC